MTFCLVVCHVYSKNLSYKMLSRTLLSTRTAARRAVQAAPRVAASVARLSTAVDESHNDFKPKTKVSPNDPDALKAQINEVRPCHSHSNAGGERWGWQDARLPHVSTTSGVSPFCHARVTRSPCRSSRGTRWSCS